MKIMSTFLILLIMFSCGSGAERTTEEKTLPENAAANEAPMKEAFSQDSARSKKFVNDDEFVYSVIDDELTVSFLDSTSTTKTKTTIPNLHNKSVSDTVITFSNGTDYFKFHKAPSNTILTEAEIISDRYKIGNGEISVGVPYKVLQDRFNLDTTVDTLIVKDFENSNYFMFLFDKEQKVNKIVFRTRYLD